jgi:hypothetical protein
MALRRCGINFEVIDVGYKLEEPKGDLVRQFALTSPGEWNSENAEALFPSPRVSTKGVERRFAFGSQFPYRVPDFLSIRTRDCLVDLSHAFGGLANVWGAAILPYTDESLKKWPISVNALEESYKNILRYIPLSGELDGLQDKFPLYCEKPTRLRWSGQAERLLHVLSGQGDRLRGYGVSYGRSRLAVDASHGPSGCKYCGRCLEGCVYSSIFTPVTLWKKLRKGGLRIYTGYYVIDFSEMDDHVEIRAVGVEGSDTLELKCKRLFLAAGHIATTRLIASSLKKYNEKIKIMDSQYFFFPFFTYKTAIVEANFSLAEVFIEVLNKDVSENYVHFQVYGKNELFERVLRSFWLPQLIIPRVVDRMLLFQGFIDSQDSGHLLLTVKPPEGERQELVIEGVENLKAARVAKHSRSLMRKHLIHLGLATPMLVLVSPGRSFHSGGSFPMGGNDPFYSSDTLGRPAGLKRVHIVDAACFPSIPASTIALSIMANADRIVESCMYS